jgi:hypothetical protein
MWSSRAIVISLAANMSVREETRKAERLLRAGETKPRPVLRLLVLVLHKITDAATSSGGLIAASASTEWTAVGLPDKRSSLCVRLRRLQLFAVTSCAPLAVLRALREMRLLAFERTSGSGPSIAMHATHSGLVGIWVHGLDRRELAVGVCVGWTRHGLLAPFQNATDSSTRDGRWHDTTIRIGCVYAHVRRC